MEECPMTFINTYTTKFTSAFFVRSKVLLAAAGILLLSLLIACAPPKDGDGGTDDTTYTVGGTVAGHNDEVSLNLTYGNETETLKIEAGTEKFTFDAKLLANQSFTIAVTAPDGQTCSSSQTQGTIVDANVTNISVTCSIAGTYSVSGSVTGAGDNSQITITLSHADAGPPQANIATIEKTPNADGTFTFDIPENKIYLLSVASATADEVCTPDATTYSAPITADVTDADITCSIADTYTVSGKVSGLMNGETITLTLSHTGSTAETKDVTGDADETTDDTFTFDTRLVNGATYAITTSQPTGKTCTVAPAGQRTMGDADVTDIAVTCVATTYSVGGRVSGLANGENITLTLSPTGGTAENKDITADADGTSDDTFVFDTELKKDVAYEVTVTSQPTRKFCTIFPEGTQNMGEADVDNITVTCVLAYAISGTVTGAANNATVFVYFTLYNDNSETEGNRQPVRVNDDGTFTITGIPENKFYTLDAVSTTTGETCSSSSTTPTQITTDITGAQITCSIPTDTGPTIRIRVVSFSLEAALATVNVFVSDNAIPAASNSPDRVIMGSDSDVTIVDMEILGSPVKAFFYDAPIDLNKYFRVTVTTASSRESCSVGQGTGGPILADSNFSVFITCQQ